jgi:hypothetical protein
MKLLHSLGDQAAGLGGVMWAIFDSGDQCELGVGLCREISLAVLTCLPGLVEQDSGLIGFRPQMNPLCSLHIAYEVSFEALVCLGLLVCCVSDPMAVCALIVW